jgi:hypothetical protein
MALLALTFLANVPDAGLHPGTFLAYLAYRSIFFLHASAGQGAYLSFLSQSAFFFRKLSGAVPHQASTDESFSVCVRTGRSVEQVP